MFVFKTLYKTASIGRLTQRIQNLLPLKVYQQYYCHSIIESRNASNIWIDDSWVAPGWFFTIVLLSITARRDVVEARTAASRPRRRQRRRQPLLRPPTERLSFARRLVLGFFCVNGMEPIWTLPSRFGLGITLIYVDWLHYYVHCAHPTLRCEAALIRAAAAASSMSMPLCFGVPKRPPRLPRAHPRGSHRANAV